MTQRIRVGVTGISGLLGFRLAQAIARQSDLELTVGIAKADQSLQRLVALGSASHPFLPRHLFLDDTHKTVRRFNTEQQVCQFRPLDQCNLGRHCDVVVDAVSPGRSNPFQIYKHFAGPVIFQSGENPLGQLIAPPIVTPGEPGPPRYRQGYCIVSALSPILASFQHQARYVRIAVQMQYSDYLHDYPTSQRTSATYIRDDLVCQFENELTALFPRQTTEILTVLQVPGLDYYTVTVQIECDRAVTGQEVLDQLMGAPRIALADERLSSTYEIDHLLREPAHLMGRFFPPIVVYRRGLSPAVNEVSRRIKLQFTIYSRFIAVLPNIDSIRILGGMDPFEAMRRTDAAMSI